MGTGRGARRTEGVLGFIIHSPLSIALPLPFYFISHMNPFTQISVLLPCSEYEKQTKLNRFQGAAAISSNDYFDRDGAGSSSSMGQGGGGGGDDMDLSAADLVNRLSFQVGQPHPLWWLPPCLPPHLCTT